MKDIAIRIVNIALVVVTVFLTLMSGVLLYYKTIGKDKVPSAITSTYATTVEDPQTGEQLPTIEANYYSNRNDNGYEVIELLFNCYSGISKQAIYSRGFQLVINEDGTRRVAFLTYVGAHPNMDTKFRTEGKLLETGLYIENATFDKLEELRKNNKSIEKMEKLNVVESQENPFSEENENKSEGEDWWKEILVAF